MTATSDAIRQPSAQPMKVQYVGFSGFGNLGDDALREAVVERTSSDLSFHDAPLGRKALLRRGLAQYVQARGAPALLGGGTVLGRTLVRTHLRRIEALYRPASWEMLGAGVEDPDFRGTRTYTSEAELELWKPILDRFRNVTVRGPKSQAILARHGIDSDVVGDPALLLEAEAAETGDPECDLLVNATCGEDQWGGVDLDWTPALAEAIHPLVAAGLRIQFVSMEPTDDAWNERVAGFLGVAPVIHRPGDAVAFCALAAAARLVVAARLHCCVLAAAAGTVPMALEYRPKNRDFMASIELEELCFRVDRLEPAVVREGIERVLADEGSYRSEVTRSVDELRGRLRGELVEVEAALRRPEAGARR